MPSIIVDKLCKNFNISNSGRGDISALDNVSFTINEGEKVGLIGLNGSGKTTLLRLISGIYKPSGGSIITEGKIIPFIDYSWAKMRLSVMDNIYLGGALYGLSSGEINGYLLPILEFAELSEHIYTPVCQLSTGMRERLVISLSLHIASGNGAGILLVDELFSNSDIGFTLKAIKKLEELNKMQVTILMTSHNVEAIFDKCDRIIWLDGGKIIKIGASSSIIEEYLIVHTG